MDASTAVAAAVIDNARWCHLVCATNGIDGRFDRDAWTSPRRTPPMYPDAVTLTADTTGDSLLPRIERGVGSSIKDSFATLDLAAAGFTVLFDAAWIARAAGRSTRPATLSWERLERADDLHAWSVDHGAGSTLSPALLHQPSVVIMAGRDRDGRRAAGAIATEGDAAVGISNVFAVGGDGGDANAAFADAFAEAAAAIAARFPDLPLVGYLSMQTLDAARAAGFEAVGPLRIWIHQGP